MTEGRVAITGVGIVSALGASADRTFERLVAGERGFSEIDLFDTQGLRARFAAQVRGLEPRVLERDEPVRPLSRTDALALAAARDAVRAGGLSSPLPDATRLGIAVGVTTGGMLEAEAMLARFPSYVPSREAVERLISYPISSTADRLGEAFGAPASSRCAALARAARARSSRGRSGSDRAARTWCSRAGRTPFAG
jgi:3-oxoacyl-[acyl-carrier-protein] synthase II